MVHGDASFEPPKPVGAQVIPVYVTVLMTCDCVGKTGPARSHFIWLAGRVTRLGV